MRLVRRSAAALAIAGGGAAIYRGAVSGALVLDVGVGRRVQRLEPISILVAAPPEVLFDVIAAPYLGRTPRAMAGEIEVLERGTDMVLAAHRTPVARSGVAVTVETVRFERPHTVTFRLLRGPVPHVVEHFRLRTEGDGARLDYDGELGTDLWALGAAWGALVARKWVATVRSSLDTIAAEAERRAGVNPDRPGG